MTLLDETIEWVTACRDAYNTGEPEAALDQAGDLAELLVMALEEAKAHSDVAEMVELRLAEHRAAQTAVRR